MLKLKYNRGQSTVEYILLVTAVIAVVLLFVTNPNGGLRSRMNSTLEDTSELIGNYSDRLQGSFNRSANNASPTAPFSTDVNGNRI